MLPGQVKGIGLCSTGNNKERYCIFPDSSCSNLNGHSYSAERSVLAPVPLLGVHGTFNSGKHFLFRGTAEYFRLNVNDWDFRTIDARAGIEYYPIKNLGIGADYHFFDTIVRKVPSGKLDGEIDYKFNAFSLYLAIRL